ncbi:3837_t:CDS:1, partial [Racocetra persica]
MEFSKEPNCYDLNFSSQKLGEHTRNKLYSFCYDTPKNQKEAEDKTKEVIKALFNKVINDSSIFPEKPDKLVIRLSFEEYDNLKLFIHEN